MTENIEFYLIAERERLLWNQEFNLTPKEIRLLYAAPKNQSDYRVFIIHGGPHS